MPHPSVEGTTLQISRVSLPWCNVRLGKFGVAI
jgi:hypothetical protein